MAFPASHKTVFILDGGSYFKHTSSQQPIVFDTPRKDRSVPPTPDGTAAPPSNVMPPIYKSLWTCSVESVVEFSRIIWDLYIHGERVIQCVVTRDAPETPAQVQTPNCMSILDGWSCDQGQNIPALTEAFSRCLAEHSRAEQQHRVGVIRSTGAGSDSFSPSMLHGISQALELLTKPTDIQAEKRKSGCQVQNRGRIILVSSFPNNQAVQQVEEILNQSIKEFNRLISDVKSSSAAELMPIRQIEAIIINTYPCEARPESCPALSIVETSKREISPLLLSRVISTKSGRYLSARMTQILLSDYDLSSSTVTGIPMKEEQNAASSSNYDVEIMHPKSAHADLLKVVGSDSYVSRMKREEETPYETILLKWCTPKPGGPELHPCSSAVRVTPVDVNSRPSTCLTNFLLAGRSVMLELPRSKGGQKTTSHMLSSHYGELYIHSLAVSRSILEDPPSISEGIGGRVTDYRINDFKELMKVNTLSPCDASDKDSPLEKSRQRIRRLTLYWPVTIGQTIMFNTQSAIEKLINLVPLEKLSLEDVQECKSAIYAIVNQETKGIQLPVPSCVTTLSNARVGKSGPKKDEIYRMLWNEVEFFIRLNNNTPEHALVLNCVQECRSKHSPTQQAQQQQQADTNRSNLQSMTSSSTSNVSAKEIKTKVGSDLDLRSAKRFCPEFPMPGTGGGGVGTGPSLFAYLQGKIAVEQERGRKEFQGRINKDYKLYEDMFAAQAKEATM